MKRFFSLALAALLLAGCTAAPADSQNATSDTPATAEAPAATTATTAAQPLRPCF